MENYKGSYLRTYLGDGYTPEEIDAMFHKEMADWKAGDRYAICFDKDMNAQVHYDRLKFNWFESSPIDVIDAFFGQR